MIRTILLADDDEDDRLLFEDALTQVSEEIALQTAEDGKRLLKLLNEENTLPDVIFLDLNMPGKNGFECLREIRQQDKLKYIPVIIFSTGMQQEAVDKVYQLGANYYICKPSSFPALKKILAKALALNINPSEQANRESFVLVNH
jgi:CheY-like chemotaxis protein